MAPYIPTKDASRATGIPVIMIREFARKGKIRCIKSGKKGYLFREDHLEEDLVSVSMENLDKPHKILDKPRKPKIHQ